MIGGAGARQGILSLAIKDKAQLYGAYMPFLKGGGIFIPTNRRYTLGDEVFLLLSLPETRIACRSPARSSGSRRPVPRAIARWHRRAVQ
jgi:Tfp pilus assembly protein PilZ